MCLVGAVPTEITARDVDLGALAVEPGVDHAALVVQPVGAADLGTEHRGNEDEVVLVYGPGGDRRP